MRETRYSLIVPVYNASSSIPELVRQITWLNSALEGRLEAVFVVDGSPDDSFSMLASHLERAPFKAELVALSRNFGSFPAIRAGLFIARGPLYAVMAADLQEPTELVRDFFRTLESEPVDLVIGVRKSRQDPPVSRFFSRVFWQFYQYIQPSMPAHGFDIFGCNGAVRETLLRLTENHSSLVAQLIWLGFSRKDIFYDRLPRHSGRSQWSFGRKVRYMLDTIFNFTNLPITTITLFGAIGSGCSAAAALVIYVYWLTGRINVPGYTAVVLSIFFSTSIIMFSLGLIGSYVWRTFENSKQRPLFILAQRRSFEGQAIPGSLNVELDGS